MVDGGEQGVDSRDEGKHTGRNDLLFVTAAPTRSGPVLVFGQ